MDENVRVTDICYGNEDLKRILFIRLSNPPLNVSFYFGLPFLSVTT